MYYRIVPPLACALCIGIAGSSHAQSTLVTGLNDPETLSLHGGFIYFSVSTGSNPPHYNSDLKRIPMNGGAVATLISGATIFDSGSYRGIGRYTVTDQAIYGSYGGYEASNVFSAPPAGGAPTTLQSISGGYYLGVKGSDLYFGSGFNYINRMPTAGGSPTTVASGLWVRSSAMDDTDLYFVDYWTRDVKKMNLTSYAVVPLITNQSSEGSIIIDPTNVYFSRNGNIYKVPKAGGTLTALVQTGTATAYLSDGTSVYFVDGGTTLRSIAVSGQLIISTAFSAQPNDFVPGAAKDSTALVWITTGPNGAIWNAPIASSPEGNGHKDNCWLRNQPCYAGSLARGSNPPLCEIKNEIEALARERKVPCEIIAAICQNESTFCQYWTEGFVVHNRDECELLNNSNTPCNGDVPRCPPYEPAAPPGLGLMQLTRGTAYCFPPVDDLITDWRYNLRSGVVHLSDIYRNAGTGHPVPTCIQSAGQRNRQVLENWYYAVQRNNSGDPDYPNKIYDRVRLPQSYPPFVSLFSGVPILKPQDAMIPGWTPGDAFVALRFNTWKYGSACTSIVRTSNQTTCLSVNNSE